MASWLISRRPAFDRARNTDEALKDMVSTVKTASRIGGKAINMIK